MSRGARKPRWLIVGAGSFGTAFARIMGSKPVELTIAARSEAHVVAMRETGTNERYFPGIALPRHLHIMTIDEALTHEWDVIVLAVPTSAFRETIERCADRAQTFLSLAKGLDPSGRRLSEAAAEVVAPERLVVLSGPNISHEIMHDLPTAAVVAGAHAPTVLAMQEAVNGLVFRVYANDDLVGVELAGATKNVVALAAGALEAAGFGNNGVAAATTRGLGEMARLGIAYGARVQTYLGLAGVGDLMTTCASPHSRNRRAGQLLARGLRADEVRDEIGQAVEGLRAAPIVRQMAEAAGVEMNLCNAVADVAEHNIPLTEVARQILTRQPRWEFATDHEFVG